MRGPIVGGLVFMTLAAAAFACGSDDNNNTSSTTDAGTDTGTGYVSPGTGSTFDASSTTFTTTFGGCNVFPRDSAWNTNIAANAVDTTLTAQLATTFGDQTIHLNFSKTDDNSNGDTRGYTITTGTATTTLPLQLTVDNTTNKAQTDKIVCPPGTDTDVTTCFPVPTTAKVSVDKNTVLFLDTTGTPSNCTVYEILNASSRGNTLEQDQNVDFASVWKLNTSVGKTVQFRAAATSGTSIFAGLLKREDITKGTITHALRMTMKAAKIRNSFVAPATWSPATSTATERFPMGTRFRLKAAIAETSFTGDALVIIRGLKQYGVILADSSTNDDFSIDGETNDGWSFDELNTQLANSTTALKLSDFEALTAPAATVATPNND